MSAERGLAIGLDVGGTNMAAGLVNLASGRVLAQCLVSTGQDRGGQVVLDEAVQLAEALQREAQALNQPGLGIGVGVCELVDPHGNVTNGHSVDWRGLPVRTAFAHLAPAWVEPDVRALPIVTAQLGPDAAVIGAALSASRPSTPVRPVG